MGDLHCRYCLCLIGTIFIIYINVTIGQHYCCRNRSPAPPGRGGELRAHRTCLEQLECPTQAPVRVHHCPWSGSVDRRQETSAVAGCSSVRSSEQPRSTLITITRSRAAVQLLKPGQQRVGRLGTVSSFHNREDHPRRYSKPVTSRHNPAMECKINILEQPAQKVKFR